MPYLAYYDLKTRHVWIDNPFGDCLAEGVAPPDTKRVDQFARSFISQRGFLPADSKWGRKRGLRVMPLFPKKR